MRTHIVVRGLGWSLVFNQYNLMFLNFIDSFANWVCTYNLQTLLLSMQWKYLPTSHFLLFVYGPAQSISQVYNQHRCCKLRWSADSNTDFCIMNLMLFPLCIYHHLPSMPLLFFPFHHLPTSLPLTLVITLSLTFDVYCLLFYAVNIVPVGFWLGFLAQ